MRARKHVLVYCRDEQRMSEVVLVLRTRYCRVTEADSLALVGHALDHNLPFDGAVVLASGERDQAEDAVRAIQRHAGRAPVLLQLDRQSLWVTRAERGLAHGASMEELVDAVRVLCSRKRGPRRQNVIPTAVVACPVGMAIA